jgi:hypothetical protein
VQSFRFEFPLISGGFMEQASRILQIERWELKAIVVEFIILAGVVMGLAVGFLAHLSMFLWIPFNVLSAVGLGVLVLALIAVQNLLARAPYGWKPSPAVRIALCVISVISYLAISSQMQ